MDHPPRGRFFGLWNEPWFNIPRPSSLFDPQFGMGVTDDEYFRPGNYRGALVVHRYMITQRQTRLNQVINDRSEFCVQLDVLHFAPDEIQVKTLDNQVIVHAKHEDTEDEHGTVCREFTRKYDLPPDVNPQTVTSILTGDGVLTIRAPKSGMVQTITVRHETTA